MLRVLQPGGRIEVTGAWDAVTGRGNTYIRDMLRNIDTRNLRIVDQIPIRNVVQFTYIDGRPIPFSSVQYFTKYVMTRVN